MVYGIGIDIVHIPRFKKALDIWGDSLKKRLFTPEELTYSSDKRTPEQHLAVRFAAKEAFFKALGRRIGFREVEVVSGRDGKPSIVFNPELDSGTLNLIQGNLQSLKTHLTLSHDSEYGIAQVILER